MFPLNGQTRGKDISVYRNRGARLSGVRFTKGPDGTPDGAVQLFGRPNSYIQFPNRPRGKLDAYKSITLLAWIYHEGRAGPIFNYNIRGWGSHFWMTGPRTLFARFMPRRGRKMPAAVVSRRVKHRKWQFVGASYDYRTGIAKLWLNGNMVAKKRVGRFLLATNKAVRMGARIGDRRYFKGRIACMQVYNKALTARQIAARRLRCFRSKRHSCNFFPQFFENILFPVDGEFFVVSMFFSSCVNANALSTTKMQFDIFTVCPSFIIVFATSTACLS